MFGMEVVEQNETRFVLPTLYESLFTIFGVTFVLPGWVFEF